MSDSSQEKSEQATQHRRDEASSKGQIAYSKELTAAALFMGAMIVLKVSGPEMVRNIRLLAERAFSLQDVNRVELDGIGGLLSLQGSALLTIIGPILATLFVIAALGGVLQVGFSVDLRRLEWQWNRISPLGGMKKLFNVRSVFTLVLTLIKMVIVGFAVFSCVSDVAPQARNLAEADTEQLVHLFVETVFAIAFRVGGALLVLGIADIAWQRWRHSKDLMMTKEEVKEDARRGEGDPKVKARIRQIQRQLARARMMQDVKTATVVVRNPTHYAVALRYESGKDPAPKVVAKGKDHLALRIIAVAEASGVPVRSEPPLARELYRTVKVGRQVPEALFQAVAKVVAWVYRQRKTRRPWAEQSEAMSR